MITVTSINSQIRMASRFPSFNGLCDQNEKPQAYNFRCSPKVIYIWNFQNARAIFSYFFKSKMPARGEYSKKFFF